MGNWGKQIWVTKHQGRISKTSAALVEGYWSAVRGDFVEKYLSSFENNWCRHISFLFFYFIKISFPVHFLFKRRQNLSARPRIYVFRTTTKRSNHSLQGINLWTAVMHVFSVLWMNWIFKCYLDKVWASSVLPILCWQAHCDNYLLPATFTIKHIKSSVFWDIILCSLKICAMFHRNTLPPYSVSKSNTCHTH